MKKDNIGVTDDSLFHKVETLEDLYEKLLLVVEGFGEFVGASRESSEDDSAHNNNNNSNENSKNKKNKSVLATLIDAGDEAGEDLLEEQLGQIAPVTISARTHVAGKCVECENRDSILDCRECEDEFCKVCFLALHRKGRRREHKAVSKRDGSVMENIRAVAKDEEEDQEDEAEQSGGIFSFLGLSSSGGGSAAALDQDQDFSFRAMYIPVRLQLKERQFLRLVQASLSVTTYTDTIDRPGLKSNKRVHAQIMKICSFLSGLTVSVDYEVGQQVLSSRHWKDHEKFFQSLLEIGRRHKVLNPDKMRNEYGRLMYMMMDASSNEIEQLLGFNVRAPLVTVHSYLKARGAEALLKDPLMEIATRAIDQMSEDGKKSRHDIRQEVKQKEAAVKKLARQYRNSKIDEDSIKWCLYSVGDNRSFLLQHRDPVQRMIRHLKRYFGPNVGVEEKYSLAIYGGKDGSRLTHTHETQYNYVLQSLTLWREIINDMFRLWCLAEEDMLDPACPYKLEDTGQGLQRVQQSPRVAQAMRDLLFRTQSKLGSNWVGSSVVHLGDKNVPNALHFLDKYAQVARILGPVCLLIDNLPELCEHKKTHSYVKEVFGSVEDCRKEVLCDFFKSAFDGSGADNFFDAGSCIDGRLTSAWNWCSQITQKRFYPIFKVSGFLSFDGNFGDD